MSSSCRASRIAWLFLAVTGCAHPPQPQQQAGAPAPQAVVAGPKPGPRLSEPPVAAPEDVHGTAVILAQKATSYAKTVEPTLQPPRAATNASVAAAIDPDQMRLTATPSTQKPDPATTPPRANRATALASATPPAAAGADAKIAKLSQSDSSNPAEAVALTPPIASDQLAERLAQRVRDYPLEVAAHLDSQLFQFVQAQPVPQLASLSPLAAEDRELVTAVLDGLSNFRNAVRADNNLLLSAKVRPFLDLADRLRNQAELVIPTVALCKRVDGFGVYEPIEPARFVAGREAPVIVYCEVENFASQLDPQKRWETRLSQEVVLYTEQNGLEVWKDKATKPMIDLSRNRRHDFFLVKVIKLPANLTIGRYLLKVSVVDEQVKRVAENAVQIQVVAE